MNATQKQIDYIKALVKQNTEETLASYEIVVYFWQLVEVPTEISKADASKLIDWLRKNNRNDKPITNAHEIGNLLGERAAHYAAWTMEQFAAGTQFDSQAQAIAEYEETLTASDSDGDYISNDEIQKQIRLESGSAGLYETYGGNLKKPTFEEKMQQVADTIADEAADIWQNDFGRTTYYVHHMNEVMDIYSGGE